ncbi:hypothetical protein ACHAWO_005891 [Cyclotella atomus]|uniref:DUF6824 domain-containing protein n=1 Tax=Cyclotella atomus TaxID=382360 RepID=A0ABD3MQK1_9STRA
MEPQIEKANEAASMVESNAAAATAALKENTESPSGLLIGKNDILFGRGGLTNRHYGNKKYRDVINEFRQEYVDARKVEKPRVAKRVVKKILSPDFADSPVRFLKRDDTNGLWVEVDAHEASYKVSQALREKTRWSCMKGKGSDSDEQIRTSVAVALKLEVETPTKKRAIDGGEETSGKKVLKIETTNKETGETKVKKIEVGGCKQETAYQPQAEAKQPNNPETSVTEIKLKLPDIVPRASEISVPPLGSSGSIIPSDGSMPTDADVLFGRGGRTNHHPGNVRLRTIVDHYKYGYEAARKTDKPRYAKAIVQALREHSTPSRFLRMNEATNQWEDVGDRRAAEKVSQTLREKEKSSPKKDQHHVNPAASPVALI